MSFLAVEKGISLEYSLEGFGGKSCINADELRLRQILSNLVGNAVKFTETGGVRVVVAKEQESADRVVLHFSVADSGIGIKAAQQQIIFENFTQAEESTNRKYGGTGLGLAISKQLVEMMGGEIWVESQEGCGSVFHFTLSVRPGSEIVIHESVDILPVKDRSLRVLLAEDNKINQDVARTVLELSGHTVCVAENGLQVLRTLVRDKIDVVLMDVQMPEMDGITASTVIRQCENGQGEDLEIDPELRAALVAGLAGQHTPIIAMTANAMSGDRQKCLDAGMDEYLTKPFMPEHIHKILHLFFQDTEMGQTAEVEPQRSEKTGQGEQAVSLRSQVITHLQTLYNMDGATADKMVQGAASSLEASLVDLTNALDTGRSEELQKVVHSLKGALLNMGLGDLAEQVAAIELSDVGGCSVQEDSADCIGRIRDFIDEVREEAEG
jgi:CheY-like chemotaxis protein/anti-sigma regulatory factor (Ser/Thr protein kinase)